MKRFPSLFIQHSRGFGLVEVMVGMLIGMLGILVMLQVFQLSEGQKRSTTGSGDAMNSGAIALYGVQRDLRQAGYGISNYAMLGCGLTLTNGVVLAAVAPVTINPAALAAANPDVNTDTLLVVYSNTAGSPQGDGVVTQFGNTVMTVNTPTSFGVGSRVIAEPVARPVPCNLVVDTVTANGAFNAVPNSNITLGGGLAGMANGKIYNMGFSPRVIAYAIKGGNLTSCDYTQNDCGAAGNANDATIWVPIANNIVSMRAQYGRDRGAPTMDGFVSGAWDQTTPATQCNWARVGAVSIALVARNTQFEKTAVTTVAPQWSGSATNAINVSAYANWQNYRYKVFQTIVPIRNIVWMGKVC